MSDEPKRTRPSWHMKELGSKLVLYAIERYGSDFYEHMATDLGLSELDLEGLMKEVDYYLDRAILRSPHLAEVDDFGMIEHALDDGDFEAWSESSKQVRAKKE